MEILSPGETVTLRGTFIDPDTGLLADPTTVTLTVTHPNGTVESFTGAGLTHATTGIYDKPYTSDADGVWAAKWDGDGALNTDETIYWIVGARSSYGPCSPWATLADAQGCAACEGTNPLLVLNGIRYASEFLWNASGMQFPGVCVTDPPLRPVTCGCRGGFPRERVSGSWSNPDPGDRWAGHYGTGCGCGAFVDEIDLGLHPVQGIIEVRIDGQVFPRSGYGILDGNRLARLDGQTWPCCQDLSGDPLTDAETFSVTAAYGTPPPYMGVRAAADLGCELAKGCAGGDCAAPERMVSQVRQGVTMQFITQDKEQIGIRSVDLFLRTFGGRRRAASIASPDVGPKSRTIV